MLANQRIAWKIAVKTKKNVKIDYAVSAVITLTDITSDIIGYSRSNYIDWAESFSIYE